MLLKSQTIDNGRTFTHHPCRMGFMSKTAAFMGMGSLRNLVSDSIAIDMGSGATIIYVHGRGVVVDEPSLVAVNNLSGEVLAVGSEARQMYGREARDVSVVAPLLNGVVADFERTREMLGYFVRQARSGASFFSRRALMSVYPGVTHVERNILTFRRPSGNRAVAWLLRLSTPTTL